MTDNIVEIVQYRLKQGVTQQELEQTLTSVSALLKVQSGFIYRSVSCDESGQWYDIVYWQDLSAAKAAGEVFMASSEGQSLCELIDMESCIMQQMPITVQTMDCDSAA